MVNSQFCFTSELTLIIIDNEAIDFKENSHFNNLQKISVRKWQRFFLILSEKLLMSLYE